MHFTKEMAEEVASCGSNSDLVTVHGFRVMGPWEVGLTALEEWLQNTDFIF